jgi:hypothetical protein
MPRQDTTSITSSASSAPPGRAGRALTDVSADSADHAAGDEQDSGSERARGRSRVPGVLTTIGVIAIVGGLAFGVWRGWGPLEARAAEIIGARKPQVAVQWPAMTAAGDPGSGGARSNGSAKTGGRSLIDLPLLNVSSTVLEETPTWLPRQMREQILALADAQIDPNASPLSAEPLVRVGETLEKSGWFDGRPTVRRQASSRIVIAGQWRVPGAVVREGAKDHLISWDGKPMPVVYEARESKLKALLNVGVKPPVEGAPVDYTNAWPGEDVQAGLELLRVIAGKPWADQIVGVDLAEFGTNQTLSIVTTGKGRLNWGGRPDRPRLGEAGTRAKVATIDWLFKRFGSIDAGGRTIDVFWEGRPLEIDVSATATRGADGQGEGETVETPEGESTSDTKPKMTPEGKPDSKNSGKPNGSTRGSRSPR